MKSFPAFLEWLDQQLAALNVTGPLREGAIALLLFAAGLVMAKLAERLTSAVSRRIARVVRSASHAPDAAGAGRGWAGRTPARVAYWLVLVLTALFITQVLELPVIGSWVERWGTHLPRGLAAIAIVAVGSAGARVARHLVTGAAASAGMAGAARLGRVTYILVVFGTWLLAVEQLGLEIRFLKDVLLVAIGAVLGSAALAFGLGAARVVTHVLEAHFVHKLYRVGQEVEFDGVRGYIVRITPLAILVDDGEAQVAIPARQLSRQRFRILTGARHK
jgi:hypothetical protein